MSSQVLRSSTVQTASRDHAEFVLDMLTELSTVSMHDVQWNAAHVILEGSVLAHQEAKRY